ncbi:MAG: hypothetical protein JXN65_08800 [Clostridia bacterium]|nr:hypothetical protein [Clostridia bacterium]
MYTFDDIKDIEKSLKKFLLFFLIGTLIFIGVLASVFRNWGTDLDPVRLPAWPAYAAGVVYAIGVVFSWGMIGAQIIRYRSFVYEMINGLERSIQGTVAEIEEKLYHDNDLEFYSIKIKDSEKEEKKTVYLDKLKDISLLNTGMNVKLTMVGNHIKDIHS